MNTFIDNATGIFLRTLDNPTRHQQPHLRQHELRRDNSRADDVRQQHDRAGRRRRAPYRWELSGERREQHLRHDRRRHIHGSRGRPVGPRVQLQSLRSAGRRADGQLGRRDDDGAGADGIDLRRLDVRHGTGSQQPGGRSLLRQSDRRYASLGRFRPPAGLDRYSDAGDPTSRYDQEPSNNGGRVNMGLEGDTPYATPSAATTADVTVARRRWPSFRTA